MVSYAESDDEDEDEIFQPIANNARKGRATKRRRVSLEDSEDEFGLDAATEQAMLEDGRSICIQVWKARLLTLGRYG